jgi:hypothetical protein
MPGGETHLAFYKLETTMSQDQISHFDPQFVESVEQMAEKMNAALQGQAQERTGAMPLSSPPSRVPLAYVDASGQVWPHVETASIIVGISYLYTREEVLKAVDAMNATPAIVVVSTSARQAQEATGLIPPVQSEPPKVGDRARMMAVFEGRAAP